MLVKQHIIFTCSNLTPETGQISLELPPLYKSTILRLTSCLFLPRTKLPFYSLMFFWYIYFDFSKRTGTFLLPWITCIIDWRNFFLPSSLNIQLHLEKTKKKEHTIKGNHDLLPRPSKKNSTPKF